MSDSSYVPAAITPLYLALIGAGVGLCCCISLCYCSYKCFTRVYLIDRRKMIRNKTPFVLDLKEEVVVVEEVIKFERIMTRREKKRQRELQMLKTPASSRPGTALTDAEIAAMEEGLEGNESATTFGGRWCGCCCAAASHSAGAALDAEESKHGEGEGEGEEDEEDSSFDENEDEDERRKRKKKEEKKKKKKAAAALAAAEALAAAAAAAAAEAEAAAADAAMNEEEDATASKEKVQLVDEVTRQKNAEQVQRKKDRAAAKEEKKRAEAQAVIDALVKAKEEERLLNESVHDAAAKRARKELEAKTKFRDMLLQGISILFQRRREAAITPFSSSSSIFASSAAAPTRLTASSKNPSSSRPTSSSSSKQQQEPKSPQLQQETLQNYFSTLDAIKEQKIEDGLGDASAVSIFDVDPLHKSREIMESRLAAREAFKKELVFSGQEDSVLANSGPPEPMLPNGYYIEPLAPPLTFDVLRGRKVMIMWHELKADGWFFGTVCGTTKRPGFNFNVKYDKAETANIDVDGIKAACLGMEGENAYGKGWVLLGKVTQEAFGHSVSRPGTRSFFESSMGPGESRGGGLV